MEHTDLFPLLTRYYDDCVGYWPGPAAWKETMKTIWYLSVNGFAESEILNELKKYRTEKISPENLSETLWNNDPDNLTRKGVFYFHRQLQIISPAPQFSLQVKTVVCEDWCVPRIRFKKSDLVAYVWDRISLHEREIWILGHNTNKELDYLLNRIQDSLAGIEPLDYLLYLIDEMIQDENKQHIKGLISVTDYIGNTLETYRNTIAEARVRGFDKPRWPLCI